MRNRSKKIATDINDLPLIPPRGLTSAEKTRLMQGQTKQDVIRRCAFCAASDQSQDVLSYKSICRKHCFRFLHNLKIIHVYEYKYKKRLI